ncbi:uncharacterized protein TNCV_1810591 [Trichonephila clavipes]|nr:uncharacterized protein TNCV_1810591 [Trichonephila clavipes]
MNIHNACICSLAVLHLVRIFLRDSPKLNVCAVSRRKVYGPLVSGKPTGTGSANLDTLQLWLFLLEESEPDNFIWQQDGAPPQWHLSVRDWLNITVPGQWIGHKGSRNKARFA